jgi:hypothetical protein
MLFGVSATALPADQGPVKGGVGGLTAAPSGLYFTTYVVQNNPGGLENSYLDGSLLRIPLAGGQPTQMASGALFQRPIVTPTSVIVGDLAFFTAADAGASATVLSFPLSGGPPTPLVALSSSDQLITELAVDETYVYVGTWMTGVSAVPLDPDAGTATVPVSSNVPNVIGAFGQKLIMMFAQGAIDSVPHPPQANSPLTTLGKTVPGPAHLISCGPNACWLAGSSLAQLDPLGGALTTIATLSGAVGDPSDVVFDGANFYLAGNGLTGSGIARISPDGRCAVVLVTMPLSDGPSVAVDDECIYWSNSQGIFSLAKTAEGPFEQQ